MSTSASACGTCNGCNTIPAPKAAEPAPAFASLNPMPEAPVDKKGSEQSGDFSPPHRLPFLLGVYLAINAIPDAVVVVDGPDCLFFKTEHVHGKHDVRSTLLDVTGRHRVAVAHVYADNIAKNKGDQVRERLRSIDANTDHSLILISSLPMVTVIGTHYDQIIRELQPEVAAQLIECPGRSLAADWLGGFEDVLQAIAAKMPIEGRKPQAGKVAVIGHLMHRNEEDGLGNVRELERMLGALDLDCTTVWVGGQSYIRMQEAANAEVLIALPHGRKAARLLAARTGARVLDVDTPFGAGRTSRFLRAVARATGRTEQAERFIRQEVRQLAPRLEWVVPHIFLGKRVAFEGMPDLLPGFLQLATELGMEVVHLSAPASRPDWIENFEEFGEVPPIFFGVSEVALTREFMRLHKSGLDLLVGTSTCIKMWGWAGPVLEFGYPSYTDHALFDRPYLGYRGFLSFVERMAGVLAANQHYEMNRTIPDSALDA